MLLLYFWVCLWHGFLLPGAGPFSLGPKSQGWASVPLPDFSHKTEFSTSCFLVHQPPPHPWALPSPAFALQQAPCGLCGMSSAQEGCDALLCCTGRFQSPGTECATLNDLSKFQSRELEGFVLTALDPKPHPTPPHPITSLASISLPGNRVGSSFSCPSCSGSLFPAHFLVLVPKSCAGEVDRKLSKNMSLVTWSAALGSFHQAEDTYWGLLSLRQSKQ